MKATRIMIAVIVVFLLTWLFFAGIYWCTSDLTYKECITDAMVIVLLFTFGWIPAGIVGMDYNEKLERMAKYRRF